MIGIKINNGFLDFSGIKFTCPFCNKEFEDSDDKLTNRISRNKSLLTTVKCECGNKFKVTSNYKSELVSFK